MIAAGEHYLNILVIRFLSLSVRVINTFWVILHEFNEEKTAYNNIFSYFFIFENTMGK